MEINSIQTPIEELNLEELPKEIQDQFWDFFNSVPFIQNLVSINRKRACELPRDDEGKIEVDLTNPHILEDMDYFRPTAINFQKTGKLTDLTPNGNPNSDYYKWAKEEVRRCREGFVRPSDGEWITGDYYYFLNYCPILQSKNELKKLEEGKEVKLKRVKRSGKRRADRISDFPKVWDGHYLVTHYLEKARDNGNHAAELSSRGRGKSYLGAALLAKRFELGESEEVNKEVQCVVTAYEKKYISGANQILDMFKKYIDFTALNTQWPSKKLINSTQNLQWKMGYKDLDTEAERGTLNSVIGITSKDDESKLRGSRGVLYLVEEGGCHIEGTEVLMQNNTFKKVEDIEIGDKLKGPDGYERTVLRTYSGTDNMYKITLSNGDYQIVNSTHPIRFIKHNWHNSTDSELLLTAPELMGRNLAGCYIEKANILYPHKDVLINPYFLGLWLGDGDSSRLDVANEDSEVLQWLSDNYKGYIRDLNQSKTCKVYHISKVDNPLNEAFKAYGLYNNKHIPDDYIYNDSEVGLNVLAGLIDTDGTYSKKTHSDFFEITQRSDRKHILDACKAIATNLGLKCTMSTRIASGKKPGTLHYRLRISGNIDIIPTKIRRKQAPPRITKYKQKRNWNYYTFKVEPYKVDKFYGFTLDKDSLFVLKDGSITHNTFPRLLGLYSTMRPSVEDGNDIFGMIFIYGTAGDENSDFASLQEIMYNPRGYNMYPLPNVYDKEGQGRKEFTYFFPGYLNMSGCYDENGNSDVLKALLEILKDRYTVKYNSSDINAITKRISEIPITPQEAIIKSRGSLFPITELSERLNQIDNNTREYDDVYIGQLVSNGEGVKFVPTNDIPIREYPLKDNKNLGAIEIFKLPENDSSGKPISERYIVCHDPVDDDESGTMSLTSTFVLDLFTDQIVAEYTGRQPLADENYEIVRKLCIFYNAKCMYESNKKGIFSYFDKMHCLWMLADTPQYLKDRDIIKDIGCGNKSKGINATASVNNYANRLIREWLLKPVVTQKELTVKDDDGVETTKVFDVTEFNLYKIRSRALLKELILFNPDGNFDRIRALGIGMLYREEYMIKYGGDVQSNIEQYNPNDDLANDPFFNSLFSRARE